jgi:hypothetical protein
MINPDIRRFLTIGLILLISSTGIAMGTQAFADNHCDKNHDKKCNHSEKNQKSTSKDPVITINPTSGPSASLVTVTGNGFDPSSPIVISFQGDNRVTVTWPSNGAFSTTFNVPSTSSNGEHIVKASQESNSVSKTFKVTDMVNPKATQGSNSSSKTFTNTSSVAPTITLNSTSEPVGTSVNITGAGFDHSSTVVITFNDTDITTTPTTVTTNNNGEFFANFTVPTSSSVGFVQVVATQGSNSASETFIVTSTLVATSQPNVNATGQSNVNATGQSNVNTTAPSSPNLSEMMIPHDIFA